MKYLNLRQFFKKNLASDRELHAIDRRIAKEWIKNRLASTFPELRGDPKALEQAYRDLSLDATGMSRRVDGEVPSYNLNLPIDIDEGFKQG
jgi:hypothetical protein